MRQVLQQAVEKTGASRLGPSTSSPGFASLAVGLLFEDLVGTEPSSWIGARTLDYSAMDMVVRVPVSLQNHIAAPTHRRVVSHRAL